MIHISEWMPNPAGRDAGEWIELSNDGTEVANLAGWRVETSKGKSIMLSGTVPGGGYKILEKSTFKFTLRNENETVSLFSPQGKLVDQSSFHGAAAEGQSVIHTGQTSFFGAPTPGMANVQRPMATIGNSYPYGVPLAHSTGTFFAVEISFVWGLALAAAVIYLMDHHDYLRELFFGRY